MSVNLLVLVFLAILWGGSFTLIGYVVDYLSPLEIVSLRVGLAAPVLWLVVLIKRVKITLSWRAWGAFLVLGIVNNAFPFLLITWGQTRIDSGIAAVLNGATPLFGAVLAHFFVMDESLSWRKIGGLILGIGGVTLLMGPSFSIDSHGLLGQLAILLASLCYAMAGVFIKRLGGYSALETATGQLTISGSLLVILTLLSGGYTDMPSDPTLWASILGLAVFTTALAYICYFHLITHAGATYAMSVTLLVPVVAMLLGVAFLGEVLELTSVVAAALILGGVGLVIRAPKVEKLATEG